MSARPCWGCWRPTRGLVAARPGQTLIGDKNYYGHTFEADLAGQHLSLLRPARKGEDERPGTHLFKPLRQTIESITRPSKANSIWNDTAAAPPQASSSASCAAFWH